jgi:hypothetical protein
MCTKGISFFVQTQPAGQHVDQQALRAEARIQPQKMNN